MEQKKQWFLFSSIPEESLAPGHRRKILAYNPALMCVHNHFCAGAVGAAHQHPHAQLSYILSGKFEFRVDEERKILCAGDSLSVLPRQIHGCLCLEEGVVLDIFSPMREDFLHP
ncbi:MAG: cupin domain-containing protein [Firmicutes bacterium]|nr:cupin domain-containing protein [Bacillota bacterium]